MSKETERGGGRMEQTTILMTEKCRSATRRCTCKRPAGHGRRPQNAANLRQ